MDHYAYCGVPLCQLPLEYARRAAVGITERMRHDTGPYDPTPVCAACADIVWPLLEVAIGHTLDYEENTTL
jgi:hypothetical protein